MKMSNFVQCVCGGGGEDRLAMKNLFGEQRVDSLVICNSFSIKVNINWLSCIPFGLQSFFKAIYIPWKSKSHPKKLGY